MLGCTASPLVFSHNLHRAQLYNLLTKLYTMYNKLFQVIQTLRSLSGLVTATVTPYMRAYATHIAMVYAIAVVGWLLYSHRTTPTSNDNSTIDEEVCQWRQGHIESTCTNNYITTEIKQNEHLNTSNILTADNITSNTVTKSVEEGNIGYLYWLGGFLMVMITSIPWDHSSVVIHTLIDTLCISIMIITTFKMMKLVYTLLKGAARVMFEWIVVATPLITDFFGITTNTFAMAITGFLVVMSLNWESSITCQSSQALVLAVYIHIIISIVHIMVSIVYKVLSLTSTFVGCAARGIIHATANMAFGLVVWFGSGVVTLLRIRELSAGLLMVVIFAIPWDHSSVVVQQLVDVLIASLMIITVVKTITLVRALLKVASSAIDQVLEWVVVAFEWFGTCIMTLLRIHIRHVQVDTRDAIHLIPQDQQDLAWSIDTTAQWNYFQRVYIHLFLNSWDEERENGLLHPDLCNILDQMEKWEDIEEINNFLSLYEILCSDEVKEAKAQHTSKLTRVHHQLKSKFNATDDDDLDFGQVDEAPVEDDEQPTLRNYRAHPQDLSEDEIKEDVDLVQQAWYQLYNDANLPVKEKKLQINESKNDIQDIAGREEAEVSIDFFESFRHLISQLQQAAPAKFEKGSPLELLVRKCNAFHLLDDIFRLEEELRALEKQVKKEKRLEKLEKKLQSDLVGWDVPQGRSRRIRKQRVIFSPAA